MTSPRFPRFTRAFHRTQNMVLDHWFVMKVQVGSSPVCDRPRAPHPPREDTSSLCSTWVPTLEPVEPGPLGVGGAPPHRLMDEVTPGPGDEGPSSPHLPSLGLGLQPSACRAGSGPPGPSSPPQALCRSHLINMTKGTCITVLTGHSKGFPSPVPGMGQ